MSGTEQQPLGKNDPLVTVIVPVYNAMPYLREFLDSLVGQDLEDSAYTVLLVDDGSTDEGPAVMDAYAADHRNFAVRHEENSGWPGTPRNLGLSLARTKYVFFADSDDVLAPGCLRSMVEYAEEHASDIVIPQLAGMTGRKVPDTKQTESTPDVGLVQAFRTLGPIKLYRRALLSEHAITFPSEKVRLEDGIFNAQAYLVAHRISALAGQDNYHVRTRDDGQNISVQPLEPYGYTGSLARMCRIVNAAGLDETTRRGVVLGLFQRKCLKIYHPGRFIRYKDYRRSEWVSAHRAFVEEFVTPEMETRLPHPFNVRTRLLRSGDIEALVRLQKYEPAPLVQAEPASVSSREGGGIELEISISVEGALGTDQMVCELWNREGNGHAAFALRAVGGTREAYASFKPFVGVLPGEVATGLAEGTYDFYVARLIGGQHVLRRIPLAPGVEIPAISGLDIYATVRGNLSAVKTDPMPSGRQVAASPRQLATRGIKKTLARVARLRGDR